MANNDQNSNRLRVKNSLSNYVDLDAPHTEVVEKIVLRKKDLDRKVVREFISVSKHLDDNFVELLLAEAYHRARIPEFLDIISNYAAPPMKYADSPRNLKLPDFIQREWINKGFNPPEIDRQMLAEYDKKLVRAIENYEYNHGLLDDKMRFQKAGNKKSRREMNLDPN